MGLVQMGRSISKTAPSPCTSKTSSVPPKKTVIPSFIRVGEIRWDAVNFIYWVTNLLHPQKLTLLVFFSFRVRSSFQLLSFSSPWSFSVLHSFRGPFVPCGGGPSGLYHFYFFFLRNDVYFLHIFTFALHCVIEGCISGSLKEVGCAFQVSLLTILPAC